jgi:uncharacterized UPF0160 family protein
MSKEFPYYTHAGRMHTDEIAGWVIASGAGICSHLVRLTDLEIMPKVGLKADIFREYDPKKFMFDHHQGWITRENGAPLATAGMLWKEYGRLYILINFDSQLGEIDTDDAQNIVDVIWERVDVKLIQGLDANDADSEYDDVSGLWKNGVVDIVTLPRLINMMNNDDVNDHHVQYNNFLRASGIVKMALDYFITGSIKIAQAAVRFDKISKVEGKVVILSEPCPWKEILHKSGALFVITESSHPGNPFSMVAVPIHPNKRRVLCPIEKPDWFKGFVHQGKWIAGAKSIRELIDLAEYSIKRNER